MAAPDMGRGRRTATPAPETTDTPTVITSAAESTARPDGDTLLPVAGAIVAAPHRGRRMTLVVAVGCPHCGATHRHLTTLAAPRQLDRACPVTGRRYTALRTREVVQDG